MQPNLSSKERITSSGIADPPEAQTRSDEASMPSEFGWLRIAAYIVGTPCMIVTCSFSITSMAAAGSKRGMRARLAPAIVGGVEADDQAEDVEERQAAHDDVVGGDLLDRRAPSAAR